MTSSQHQKCKLLIERIFQRQLNKPVTYHPILMREFNEEECELIFGEPHELDECTELIQAVYEGVLPDIKSVLKVCKMMLPRNINGLYDARHEIEISIDLIRSELLIEIHHPSYKILTKEELIALYLRDRVANYYNSTLRGNSSLIETFSIK